jgi:hypothetical protein
MDPGRILREKEEEEEEEEEGVMCVCGSRWWFVLEWAIILGS